MIARGIDMARWLKSATADELFRINQTLGMIDTNCPTVAELRELLSTLVEDDMSRSRRMALEAAHKVKTGQSRRVTVKAPPEKQGPLQPPPIKDNIPQMPVGLCPRCDKVVKGYPMPGCESKKTGRIFYKECTSCSYYSEIFQKRKNRYTEVEGG